MVQWSSWNGGEHSKAQAKLLLVVVAGIPVGGAGLLLVLSNLS